MSEEMKENESKNELAVSDSGKSGKPAKKDTFGREFKKLYDEKLPELLSTNLSLQERALRRVEETIDGATAVQAATIYGILHDKMQTVTGKKETDTNTINMYFGESMNKRDQEDLMMRVLNRAKEERKSSNAVDAEYREVD